jgi:PAS domain S-box-containing protein
MPLLLPDFLDAWRDEVLERWLRRARVLCAPRQVTDEDLLDSLPLFLKETAGALRLREGQPSDSRLPARSEVAKEHGLQRLRLGFDVALVVREYALLRDCILEAMEEAGFALTARHWRLLSHCIDTGTADAVTQYVEERLRYQRERTDARAGQVLAERELEEYKRQEAALRESEERFRLLVESVKDYGLFMVSPTGVIQGWNLGAQRLKGYTAEEIVGESMACFFPREEVEKDIAQRLLQRAEATGGAEYEGWLVRKDGSTFWATVIFNPVRDEEGHLKGFSNVARDLTERRRMEQTQAFLARVGEVLAGSLDYETTLQEAARLATYGLADWCVVWGSAEDGTLLPLAVVHAVVDKAQLARTAVRGFPPGVQFTHSVGSVVRTGQSELCADIPSLAWAAQVLGVESAEALQELGVRSFMCVPLRARGRTFGAMTFVSATPGRRYSAADLAVAEELARRSALALDNASLYSQLLARVEFEQHLAGIVGHDLSTPIQSIRLSAEMLLADSEALDARHRRGIQRIHNSAQRIKRMTAELLDFTRARLGGGLQINRQPLDLHALTQQVVDELATAHPTRQVQVVHAGEAVGEFDADRVAQLLTNLVNNALSYSPAGSAIRVETRGEGEAVVLQVHNSGAPIPREKLSRIFEPMERGAQSGGDGRSIGLGLFIVGHIVRAHGGTVEVRSTQEEGTTFTVRLPRHALSTAAPAEAPPVPSPSG